MSKENARKELDEFLEKLRVEQTLEDMAAEVDGRTQTTSEASVNKAMSRIQASLDRFARGEPIEFEKAKGETSEKMTTWLSVSGSDMLARITQLVTPSMPNFSATRSIGSESHADDDSVLKGTLRDLGFVPLQIVYEETGENILTLRYFGKEPTPSTAPSIKLLVDGETTSFEIDSNLPSSPPEVDLIWAGQKCALSSIGISEAGEIVLSTTRV